MSHPDRCKHYRLLAEKLLTDASQNHPSASKLYYAIGRTYQAEADQNTEQVDLLRVQRCQYYRAARCRRSHRCSSLQPARLFTAADG